MVSYEVEPWRRHEGGQFLEQFMRREHQVGGAVGPERFQRECELVRVDDAQSSRRQSRAGDIAAQLLESLTVFGHTPALCPTPRDRCFPVPCHLP